MGKRGRFWVKIVQENILASKITFLPKQLCSAPEFNGAASCTVKCSGNSVTTVVRLAWGPNDPLRRRRRPPDPPSRPLQYLPPSRAIAESEERAKKLSAGEPPLPIAGAACMGEGEEEETSAITFVHLH